MTNVYKSVPQFDNEKWLLRFVEKSDVDDLLAIYSDKNALPFFNSDNCDGDNFYYHTKELMDKAVDFWLYSYKKKFFVRWTIVDKAAGKAIGTIEMFKRRSDDAFNESCVLRLDVGSAYEKTQILKEIMSLIIPPAFEMFDCEQVIIKVPVYAVERIAAVRAFRFEKSDAFLLAKDGTPFTEYWVTQKKTGVMF